MLTDKETKNGDKETFTKEELCKWLDTIADAKDQE